MKTFKAFFLVSLLLLYCTRDDHIDSRYQNANTFNLARAGILPVKLSRYNIKPSAKSLETTSDSTQICIDSLVDFSICRQIYFEESRWIYEQFSMKSNKSGLYGALVPKYSNYEDSLVQIKCYYMRVSNVEEKRLSEYVVTMLPTWSYSHNNPGFDFLSKPSFSGIILYSSITGELLQCEYILAGRVFRCGVLESGQMVNTKSGPTTKSSLTTCTVCGVETNNSSGFCSNCEAFFLDPVVVSGIRDQDILQEIWLKLFGDNEEQVNYQQGEGGGGSNGNGGSGNLEQGDLQHFVTLYATGCHYGQIDQIPFVHGSTQISISAPTSFSDSCWFNQWDFLGANGIIPLNNRIVIENLQCNLTVRAHYVKNNSCVEFANILDMINQPFSLKELLAWGISQDSLDNDLRRELASIKFSNKYVADTIRGRAPHQVIVNYHGQKVDYHNHIHTGGSIGMTEADFITMCMDFFQRSNDPLTYSYGILTTRHFISVKMKNLSTFNTFISHQGNGNALRRNLDLFFKSQYDDGLFSSEYARANRIKQILNSIGLEVYFGAFQDNYSLDSIVINSYNADYVLPTPFGCYSIIN